MSNPDDKGTGTGDSAGADEAGKSFENSQDGKFTQAELDAAVEAKAKELLDKNANLGRTEKEIREQIEAEFKADAEKKQLEADGKLKEVNEILLKEKKTLAEQLAEKDKKLETATAFITKTKEVVQKENEAILAEIEKDISEDKKVQFGMFKNSLPEDSVRANAQLKSMKSLFINSSEKKKSSSPDPSGNGGGDFAEIDAIEIKSTEPFNPFKK